MEKHFDFVGNELFAGDLVVLSPCTKAQMMYGVVISCTDEKVNLLRTLSELNAQDREELMQAYYSFYSEQALNSSKRHVLNYKNKLYKTTHRDKSNVVKVIQNYDGYHTMDELYDHRAALFAFIVNSNKDLCWKSKKHHDGSMYPDMFIVGMDTEYGQISYHYNLDKCWGLFKCKELDTAPEFDGHTPMDVVERLNKLNRSFSYLDDKYCKNCKGTGYVKSYCDEPDKRCLCCNGSGLKEDTY